MTKKEILTTIGNLLRGNNMEVCVVNYPELHEVGTKMHAYAIGYDPYSYNCVVVRPWSGADYSWPLDITRITKARLTEILNQTAKLAVEIANREVL